MTRLWTTIKDSVLLDEHELLGKCDIVLMHLGGYQYGLLTKIEHTKRQSKVKPIKRLRDKLIHIRQNSEQAHNTRLRKQLNYKDLSEEHSPPRPTRKQPYKPLPRTWPSDIHMIAQDTIDERRKSKIIGFVTIKTEDEKPKIKMESDPISSDTHSRKRQQSDPDGHC